MKRWHQILCLTFVGSVLILLLTCQEKVNAQSSVYHHHYSHHRYAGYGGGSHYHQRAAAMAQAQRVQMIRVLQMQVSNAKKVLETAESNSAMSQAKLTEAILKLDGIESEMASIHHDVHESTVALHKIEAEILSNQNEDSSFAKATQAVDETEEKLEHLIIEKSSVLHSTVEWQLTSWRSHLAKLNESERATIKTEPAFVEAMRQLTQAEESVSRIRKELFANNKEWVSSKEHQQKMLDQARKESVNVKPAKLKSNFQKHELQSVQEVIVYARNIVAQGELRLLQLGAYP